MTPSLRRTVPPLALALVFAFTACGGCGPATGAAQVRVSLDGLAADVTEVRVSLTGEGIVAAIETTLSVDGGQWTATLGEIPAGANRTFLAEASNSAGTVLFRGSATGVTITAGETAVVVIVAQQVDPDPGFENAAPTITALTASADRTAPGGVISLSAQVEDPDGDPLTQTWTATGGTFETPNALQTLWVAPAAEGTQTVTFTVRDPSDATATTSLVLLVESTTGTATVTVALNHWPQVSRLTAEPSQLRSGEATRLTAISSDLDADALTHTWSASCAGAFSDAAGAQVTFTPTDSGLCDLLLEVSDGRGGTNTGRLGITVAEPLQPNYAPSITTISLSSYDVGPGVTVTLFATAADPEGQALTFDWTASSGTLGVPSSGETESSVEWTAPACAPPAQPVLVRVTATEPSGLSASRDFAFNDLPPCP